MIAEYEPTTGAIHHIIFDPIHPDLMTSLIEQGKIFIEVPKTPWPPEPAIHPITMEPILDENGEPVLESKGYDVLDIHEETYYVSEGALVERPILDLPGSVTLVADGVTEQVLTVPPGTEVWMDNTLQGVVEDGTLELVSDMVESYTIILKAWPHQDKWIEVTSNAA